MSDCIICIVRSFTFAVKKFKPNNYVSTVYDITFVTYTFSLFGFSHKLSPKANMPMVKYLPNAFPNKFMRSTNGCLNTNCVWYITFMYSLYCLLQVYCVLLVLLMIRVIDCQAVYLRYKVLVSIQVLMFLESVQFETNISAHKNILIAYNFYLKIRIVIEYVRI